MSMRMLFVLVAPFLLMLTIGVETTAQETEEVEDLNPLTEGNAAFAFDLYDVMTERAEGENFSYSPYSISQAIGMLYAGADGETAAQIEETLRYALPADELASAFGDINAALQEQVDAAPEEYRDAVFQLNIANALWGQEQYPFAQPFLNLLRDGFGSELQFVDFRTDPETAHEDINSWIAEKTEGKIQNVVPQDAITPNTRLVLANAIYFNARWRDEFVQFLTEDADFTTASGDIVQVPMMSQENSFRYVDAAEYAAVALPYIQSQVSMIVILPDDLETFEQSLDAEVFANIVDSIQSGLIVMEMPRFEIEADLPLGEVLVEMGMVDAFSRTEADLSNMVEDGEIPAQDQNLYVSSALHRAVVKVDEEGTEAAAVTAIIVGALGGMVAEPEFTFRADKPFIFAIYDNETETILFLGRVTNPQQ